MSKKSIFIRGIDEDVYREVKLRAVLLGVSVSEIVNAALREWLKKPVIVKEKKDPSREIADSLVEKYLKEGKRGYIIVIDDGARSLLCSSIEEAIEKLRNFYEKEKFSKALIRKIEPRKVEFLEVGGSLLEIKRGL